MVNPYKFSLLIQHTYNYILQLSRNGQRHTANVRQITIAESILCFKIRWQNDSCMFLMQADKWQLIAGSRMPGAVEEQIIEAITQRKSGTCHASSAKVAFAI